MRGDVTQRQDPPQRAYHRSKRAVLSTWKGSVVGALKLQPYGKVIATLAASPRRRSGVPSATLHGNELEKFSVAAHKKVRRDTQSGEASEIGVCTDVQAIGEEALDRIASELPGRQADRVK